MKALVFAFLFFAAVWSACSSRAQTPVPADGLASLAALLPDHRAPESTGPALTLDEVERIALAVNPEIEVAVRRVVVAQARVPVAGALDDPMAMYRGWGIPLKKPWDYNAAQNMFSLSETLPGRGKQALRTSIAQSGVEEAKAGLDLVRLQVRINALKAFDDLLRAQDELRIHERHVALARQAIDAARIKYEVGKVPQQDILKAQVTLTRLAEHMIRVDQDAELARGHLNSLLARDPAAPLRIEGEHAVLSGLPAAQALQTLALESRPDLAAARAMAEQSHKEQALAKTAYIPDFTVSAGYMVMPSGSAMRNDYMVEATMNLPWLNHRKHDAEIAESTARVTEQDAELIAMRNAAFSEIQSALIETQSSQRLARMYREQIQPQAEATLQSSIIAYENNKTDLLDLLDSQMTVIDVDLARLRAVADFDTHLADLELTTGATIQQFQTAAPEVKQ